MLLPGAPLPAGTVAQPGPTVHNAPMTGPRLDRGNTAAAGARAASKRHGLRQVTTRLAEALDRERPGLEAQERLEALAALAAVLCLDARGILPRPLAESGLTRTGRGSAFRVDDTGFAQASRLAFAAGPLLASAHMRSVLAELARTAGTGILYSDPLFPGAVVETLRQSPRWQLTGRAGGISCQSAGARDVPATSLPALTQWFTPGWLAEFLIDETVCRSDRRTGAGEFFDPAVGSGALVVPALKAMVRLSESSLSESVETALSERLFAADIDRTMVDLANFSIYLCVRDMAPGQDFPLPHIYQIARSAGSQPELSPEGSLWLGCQCPDDIVAVRGASVLPLRQSALARKFSAIASNPPYLSHRLIPPEVSTMLRDHYASGRFDLYSAFVLLIERLLADDGRMAVLCQQSFLTTARYAGLRSELSAKISVDALVHLGPGVFPSRSGEKVSSAVIVASRQNHGRASRCWRIADGASRAQCEKQGLSSLPYTESQAPLLATAGGGNPAFWCPAELRALLSRLPAFESEASRIAVTNGLFTCNNSLFVRRFDAVAEAERGDYVPYEKGGGGKWFRSTTHVIRWQADGASIREYRRSRGQSTALPGERYYFQEGVTYSYIGTRTFRARLLPAGCVFDIAGSSAFSSHYPVLYVLGLLNSSLIRFLLGALNPTVNFQIGDIRRLPFAEPDKDTLAAVVSLAGRAVETARQADCLDPLSPACRTPLLARFGAAGSRSAYQGYLDYIAALNAAEAQCQMEIDARILDLYCVSEKTRAVIASDPWVVAGMKPIARPLPFAVAAAEAAGLRA